MIAHITTKNELNEVYQAMYEAVKDFIHANEEGIYLSELYKNFEETLRPSEMLKIVKLLSGNQEISIASDCKITRKIAPTQSFVMVFDDAKNLDIKL